METTEIIPKKDETEQITAAETQEEEDDYYSFCPFLESLVIENNLEERDNDLLAFQIFVAKNKPSYKLLEDELMLFINKNYKKVAKAGENPLAIFVSRLIDLYEAAKKKGLNPLIMKIFLRTNQRLKFEHSEDFNKEVKQFALDAWTRIDGININNFLNTFEIKNEVNPEDLIPVINNLITNKKMAEVAHFISTMELHQHFNIPDLISSLVHQNKFPLAALLVENKPEHQITLVREMTTNKLASKAADFVKLFKLNPSDFPELIERLQKNCLRFYVHNDVWMKVEEKFYDFKNMLGFYVEDLVFREEFDLAVSITKRHNLLEGGHIKKEDTIEALKPYFADPPTKTFNYTENKLLMTDFFEPTEEILGEAPKGTYWNFKDFGIDLEKDLIYIDNCEDGTFDAALEHILSADVVGLDSEFRISMTKFDKQGTALLQLATKTKLFVFDSLKLWDNAKYNGLIQNLFSDPKILKVGHTLSADLEILRNDQVSDSELVIRNHLDLPKAFKGLYPELKQSSLAYICEKITKKPMSKYEQISNWNKRPLRKAQLHYGAMDAYILLKIYEEMKQLLVEMGEDIEKYIDSSIGGKVYGNKKSKLTELEDEKIELEDILREKQFEDPAGDEERVEEEKTAETKKKPYRPKNKEKGEKKEEKVSKTKEKKEVNQFFADEKYAHFYSNPDTMKFLIDNMAEKLARYMRNIGLDAEYLREKDHNQLTELAKLENRVIVTRDQKYFVRQLGVPCFFLNSQKTSDQLKELIDYFHLQIKENNFLSRCVKCNSEGLIVLDVEDAKKALQWKNEDDYQMYDTYWQCDKCKQIYWEGQTFKKAQQRFKEFELGEGGKDEAPIQESQLDSDLQSFDFAD